MKIYMVLSQSDCYELLDAFATHSLIKAATVGLEFSKRREAYDVYIEEWKDDKRINLIRVK